MKNLEKLEEILENDVVIKHLRAKWLEAKHCNSLFLTGGAVIDLLEGRTPKDYDFVIGDYDVDMIIKKGTELGLIFEYTSATAVSFSFAGHDLQVLRKPVEEFPFTIEQSKFSIRNGKLEKFDNVSFESKKLIPNDVLIFNVRSVTRINFLNRIAKWENKGYSIHNITKKSYIKCTKHTTLLDKLLKLFTPKESKES